MADYETDDLYPNDGMYFSLPLSERRKEANEEKKEVERLEPLLKESIKRLKKQVEFYGSLDAIADDLLTSPDEFMHAVAANKIVRTVLLRELKIQEGLYADYLR